MEQTVAVWYREFLALYKISGGRDGIFNAELIQFNGPSEASPPQEFPLHKDGRHWTDDDTNQDLLDELGKAIEIQVTGVTQISNPRRSSDYGRSSQ
jgi:hypothetical protein